jgi:hypothetical protein
MTAMIQTEKHRSCFNYLILSRLDIINLQMALPFSLVVESDGTLPVPVPPAANAHPFPHKPDGPRTYSASMLELLEIIQKKVHLLTTHIGHNGTPRSAVNDDEQMQNHRRDLLSATQSLHDLALGPKGILESIHVCPTIFLRRLRDQD